jgi:excisionase family DNA binding protein
MSEIYEATPVSQPFPHFERFLNSSEAAQLLQIHPKTLQRLARKGEIRAMRIGKLWRFRASDLHDLHAWVDLRLKLANYPYRPNHGEVCSLAPSHPR